jgi:hypothetical protein
MVATPGFIPHSNDNPVVKAIQRTNTKIDAVASKTLHSVSVVNTNGETMFSIVPSDFVDEDGSPIVSLTINDPISGFAILRQEPAAGHENPDGTMEGTNWFWHMDDAADNRLVATDGLAGKGLALPYFDVSMYRQWTPTQSATPSSIGNNYATVAASLVAGAGLQYLMWEGRVGYCSHPFISVNGIWGNSSGGSAVPTYTLVMDGVTVGSWTASSFGVVLHEFDCSDIIGNIDIQTQLFMHSSVSSSDQLACAMLGTHLRQSPAAS